MTPDRRFKIIRIKQNDWEIWEFSLGLTVFNWLTALAYGALLSAGLIPKLDLSILVFAGICIAGIELVRFMFLNHEVVNAPYSANLWRAGGYSGYIYRCFEPTGEDAVEKVVELKAKRKKVKEEKEEEKVFYL